MGAGGEPSRSEWFEVLQQVTAPGRGCREIQINIVIFKGIKYVEQ